ncbi:thymidylate synthase [bacterium]|nr:thymidylate synthase [bacterium]
MNKLDAQYQGLLDDILNFGVKKNDRTGTGTLSVFGRQIRHKMSDGFPLLTTKKMAIKSVMTELKWFLKGDTNIKYLVDNGCKIWNGDAYKNYLNIYNYNFKDDDTIEPLTMEEFMEDFNEDQEFRDQWGDLGPIYGKQWRSWKVKTTRDEKIAEPGVYTKEIDQIANLINELKTNPDSRRLMVSAWNVGELDNMTLPPCHYGFQVYTRVLGLDERIDYMNKGKISKSSDYFHEHLDSMGIPKRSLSLMWSQRSVDTFLGLPFNIASYGMLLSLLSEEVGMIPGELIGNLGDTHLYLNHVEQAEEQLSREPKPHLPKLKLLSSDIMNGDFDYELLHYHSHPPIKAPLSN